MYLLQTNILTKAHAIFDKFSRTNFYQPEYLKVICIQNGYKI